MVNKLIIDGEEIELSKESIKTLVKALVEPEVLVPKSINLFEFEGRVHIGFGNNNEYLVYDHTYNDWDVVTFEYVGSQDRFKLVKTTFKELDVGDVFLLGELERRYEVDSYRLKILSRATISVTPNVRHSAPLFTIGSVDTNSSETVYKVVPTGE